MAQEGSGTRAARRRGLARAHRDDGPLGDCLGLLAGDALPALDIAPAPWKQEGLEVAIDASHHLTHAAGASTSYALLDR